MKTDWAAAATRAGNRVLAENQECQVDQVASLGTLGNQMEVDQERLDPWKNG